MAVAGGRAWWGSLTKSQPRVKGQASPPSHLHMISWVSSTRHISGFLSCPS